MKKGFNEITKIIGNETILQSILRGSIENNIMLNFI